MEPRYEILDVEIYIVVYVLKSIASCMYGTLDLDMHSHVCVMAHLDMNSHVCVMYM
jgi:hypothetical protein